MYLIQGVFFQKLTGLDLDFSEGDARAVIRTSGCYFMYAGAFGPDPEQGGVMRGRMNDHFGDSTLTNIIMPGDGLRFTKQYDGREEFIHYAFQKGDGGTLIGGFDGPGNMSGESKCVLAQVPDNFFAPTQVVEPRTA